MQGAMAVSPRRRRRSRVASPIELRNWVTYPAADGVFKELCLRIDALEAVGKPWAELFLSGGQQLAAITLGMLGSTEAPPALTPEQEGLVIRAGAAHMVATSWARREYRRGMVLPPIMIRGVPWDTLPTHIHVLDLSPEQIRQATPEPSEVAQYAKALQHIGEGEAMAFLHGAARSVIEQLGPWAVFDPVVLTPLFYWLVYAQHSPSKEEARRAAVAADSLLDALRPDLSRHVSRTSEELTRSSDEALGRARQLRELLHGPLPLPAIRAKARDWFGARVDDRDLRRWKSMTDADIAADLLRSETGLSKKAVRDLRRLAGQAEAVSTAWQEFGEHLKTRPEPDQRRVLGALPPLISPRPPQSSKKK